MYSVSRDYSTYQKPTDMPQLKRTLGLAEVIFFGAGSILGAGIYSIVGKVAGYGGNMIWLSFAIAAFTALMSAFSYAELSAMFPRAGGEYEYVKNAFNKKIALGIGLVITLNGIVSGATVSLAFAGYLSSLWDISLLLASFGIILLVFGVTVTGIRQSSIVNIVFTLIEVSGLILVIWVAIPYIGKVDYLEMPKGGVNHILLAAALSYFAYIGFEEIVKLSEETKEPTKKIPAALFTASAIVFVLYIVIAVSVVSVLPWEQLGQSEHPLADVVEVGFGRIGLTIISVIALFSTTNTILANMTGSSRILFRVGADHKKLSLFYSTSTKNKTPLIALVCIAAIMMAFASIGKIETAALIANFFIFITFLFVNVSAILLRVKNPKMKRPYRIPLSIRGVPVPSVLGILMTLLLMGYSIYGLVLGEN
jgi:APA family basic amino acid/polyamine antiporter